VARKIWEGWIKWKKNKSARKDVALLKDETFTLFPTMCNPTTRTSSVPRSHNFLLPLHMSTILNLFTLDIPTCGLFSWSLDLKGKQPLEKFLVWQYLCWLC
jgi:hypothetical protein